MEKYIVINVVEDEICLDYMYVHQVLFSLCEVNFKLFKTIGILTNTGVVWFDKNKLYTVYVLWLVSHVVLSINNHLGSIIIT